MFTQFASLRDSLVLALNYLWFSWWFIGCFASLHHRIRAGRCEPEQQLKHVSILSGESIGKNPTYCKPIGTDHVCENTVSSISWSFQGRELNVNEVQARIGSLLYQIVLSTKRVLAVKG